MLSPPLKIYIPDLSAMADFAFTLAGLVKPGDVIALNGQLGAGKTTLIQHLGKALGVQEKIVSPTFTLIHDYVSGRFPILHVDLYRLGPENADRVAEEVLSVIQERSALVLVEWAEYGDFLQEAVTVELFLAILPPPADRPDAEPREITLNTRYEVLRDALA